MNTQVELNEMINTDLQAAYTGEAQITLTQALARICAEFYDSRLRYDRESGTYKEVNDLYYSQMAMISALANNIWAQMYDTRVNKQGYIKGTKHKLDRATAQLKIVSKSCDGTEIALQAVDRAEGWVERLETQYAVQDEMYHTIAAMMEVATGITHKPLEPWTLDSGSESETDVKKDELIAKLAARGITLGEEGYVPSTDGVGDSTNVSGTTNDKDEAAEQKRKKRQKNAA
tara:strand:- start:213 stop:905 length:693 start_codon:yes stop_codon:yes gene_type:complete